MGLFIDDLPLNLPFFWSPGVGLLLRRCRAHHVAIAYDMVTVGVSVATSASHRAMLVPAARPCIPSQSAVERPARTQIRAGLLLRCRVDYNDIVASAYAMVTVAGVARRVGDSGARASLCRLIAAIMVPLRGCQAEG